MSRLTGISRILKKASNELAHSQPNLLYMYVANMGNPPPTMFLTKMTPARADAEYDWYESTT